MVIAAGRKRTKIGATIDPELAAAVDAYVATHPGADRSGVLDEALRLWYAQQQAAAMTAQFRAPATSPEAAERRAWRSIRAASARRRSRRS